jgi:membrane protease YdiL (CAAX protease family)
VTHGRRRSGLVLLATVVVAAVVTGRAFDKPYGSAGFLRLTYVLALVLVAGAVLSGGPPRAESRSDRHPWLGPVLRAVVLFAVFAVLSWVTPVLPPVRHGMRVLLRYADAYPFWRVALAAATVGVAEEVFYRGAVFERARLPVMTATLAHVVTTLPAGNVALTLSALVLGSVLGHARRRSGGWWAPAVTHALWSVLVIAWLPR